MVMMIAAVLKSRPVTTLIMEAVAMICAPVAINRAAIEVNAVKMWDALPYRLLMICGTVLACALRK